MVRIIISENVSLDGVIQDPAGDEGFRHGGWIGRIGARGSCDYGLCGPLGIRSPWAGARLGRVRQAWFPVLSCGSGSGRPCG
jgi:hypothetical protein